MKQISTIRSILGINQQDMALLLKVHRSQYSMFESGQRDLPREAKILLAPMLAQATLANLKQPPKENHLNQKMTECLKSMIQNNELQRISMARTLQNAKSLYEKNVAILNLTSSLLESDPARPVHFKELVQSIRAKADRTLISCNPALLMKYQIKSELLELEKLLLEEFSAKYAKEEGVKKHPASK